MVGTPHISPHSIKEGFRNENTSTDCCCPLSPRAGCRTGVAQAELKPGIVSPSAICPKVLQTRSYRPARLATRRIRLIGQKIYVEGGVLRHEELGVHGVKREAGVHEHINGVRFPCSWLPSIASEGPVSLRVFGGGQPSSLPA